MSVNISYVKDPKGYLKLWRIMNHEKCKDYARNWRRNHIEQARGLDRKHREKIISKWRGTTTNNGLKSSIWKRAEQLTSDILRREGFEDILHFSKMGLHGHIDFFAKHDGICAIEVTTGTDKPINRYAKELVNYLGLQQYVLFIKPDLSGYVLKRIPPSIRRPKLTLNEVEHPTQL